MTRLSMQAAIAIVLMLLMLPLAACPGNGYKNPDAPSSPNK